MSGLPVPTERTWAVGDIATSSILNTNLRDGVNFGLNPPICNAVASTAQTLLNNTIVQLALDTTTFDTYVGHSNTTNNSRYVAQVAGFYLISGVAGFAANATGYRQALIGVNGTALNDSSQILQAVTVASIPTLVATRPRMVALNVGDYVEVFAIQSSGASLLTSPGGSSLGVQWVHA